MATIFGSLRSNITKNFRYLLATTILTKRHLRCGLGILIANALLTESTFCFFAFPFLAFQTAFAQHQPPRSARSPHYFAHMSSNRLAGYDWAQMSTNLQRKHPQSGAEQREDSREESAAEQTATEEPDDKSDDKR
ncbi:hypothetical protein RvY_19019 [Ramazzottius varieornatus]|uniref:Uncharacterized protein n=1 Tax=Ramazzottius varieornatus TaxID=947166 RepID=A0A1D1W7X5_RAMVA|nr:hypothetical protein RvY_19019 [Ramazzottius varieornatus]